MFHPFLISSDWRDAATVDLCLDESVKMAKQNCGIQFDVEWHL